MWPSSKEAASYDSKHGKTLDQIIDEIRARLDFLGVDWVDDDDKDETDGKGEEKNVPVQKKTVRLLDYACGTGVGMSFSSPRSGFSCDAAPRAPISTLTST